MSQPWEGTYSATLAADGGICRESARAKVGKAEEREAKAGKALETVARRAQAILAQARRRAAVKEESRKAIKVHASIVARSATKHGGAERVREVV